MAAAYAIFRHFSEIDAYASAAIFDTRLYSPHDSFSRIFASFARHGGDTAPLRHLPARIFTTSSDAAAATMQFRRPFNVFLMRRRHRRRQRARHFISPAFRCACFD